MKSPVPEIKDTCVYECLWRFTSQRQVILEKRMLGESGPWSDDPILNTYRFTNAYRFADRTSQYLIHEVIGDREASADDMLYRILLFKVFNRIETWELLTERFGPISKNAAKIGIESRQVTARNDRPTTRRDRKIRGTSTGKPVRSRAPCR